MLCAVVGCCGSMCCPQLCYDFLLGASQHMWWLKSDSATCIVNVLYSDLPQRQKEEVCGRVNDER